MKTAERKENSLEIDTYQQIDRAHRDIVTAVHAGLFMAGLNIIILLMLVFNPAYADKTNWLGIGSISIGILISFGLTICLDRYSLIAAKAGIAYFIIGTSLNIYLCFQGLMPSTLMMLTFIPFAPYLLYGLHRGRCGTSMLERVNLNESIDLDLENSVENFAKTKFRQQLDRAHKNIETGVRSGLLMGGITFCINVALFSMVKSLGSQITLILIFLMDILIIFSSTLGIYQKKSQSAIYIIGYYSILTFAIRLPTNIWGGFDELGWSGILYLSPLLLSTYCFYGLYKGTVGISDLERLTEMQLDFNLLGGNSNHQLDVDRYHGSETESSSTVKTLEYTEVSIEVERRYRLRQAHNDIKIAMFAALIIGIAQLPIFTTLAFNPVHIAKIGLFQFIQITVNIISIFGCAYGLYHRSQVAARMMMVYFAVNLVIDSCSQNFNIFNIALMSYTFYGAYKGIVGTSILKQSR